MTEFSITCLSVEIFEIDYTNIYILLDNFCSKMKLEKDKDKT